MTTVPHVQAPSERWQMKQPITQGHSHDVVQEKISHVYAYCAAALAATLVTALVCTKIGFAAAVLSIYTSGNLAITSLFLFSVGVGLIIAMHSAEKGSAMKKGLFGGFAVWQGILLSPLALINAPMFVVATGGSMLMTGGLGALAMTMKESFEKYEKIMMIALGALALISIASVVILPLSPILHEISYVGGFALFSAFIIFDTHRARSDAANEDFEPIDHALGIYLDAINLLIRIWEMTMRNKE